VRLKIPILPVGLPDNPKVLPDNSPYAKPGKVRLIIHKPIETAHLTDADVPQLSKQVFDTIEEDLKKMRNL
jgi:1-acyl-sn-glycerol-3-phosphate acyltransferase